MTNQDLIRRGDALKLPVTIIPYDDVSSAALKGITGYREAIAALPAVTDPQPLAWKDEGSDDWSLECPVTGRWYALSAAQRDQMEAERVKRIRLAADPQIATLQATNARLVEALRELLQCQDGVPMMGQEATRRAENARALLVELEKKA